MEQAAEPTFGGGSIPAPEVFERARRNNPAWARAFESAYQQFASRPENTGIYANPSGEGATIQQMWLLFRLFGIEMYCLLAGALPPGSTDKVSRLVKCTPGDIVGHLKAIQAHGGRIGVMTAYHDGETGHCITVVSYDEGRDRFIYHDPWPERSLLVAENNAAGVDARPQGSRWSVTAAELERVAFAAFVFPHQWGRIQGLDFDLDFDDWQASAFFSFFHLQLLEEQARNGSVRRQFAPQAFTNEVRIFIDCRASGKITCASLQMARSWVIKSFPLPFDLTKSFISCFAPGPERRRFDGIAAAFRELSNPQAMMEAMHADPKASEPMRCIHAFMGSEGAAEITSDFARLSVGMVRPVPDSEPVACVEFDLK